MKIQNMVRRLSLFLSLSLVASLHAADYVITAANGTTVTNDVINTTDRVVIQAGTGTVVLQDGNTFGSEVVVSNGYLVADYAASGLQNTHLTLVGTANSRPAIFRPKGPTFTAPLGTNGAGTISFVAYAGFAPYDQPLTVNLGGVGATLQKTVDGFLHDGYAEFDLQSTSYDLTFMNSIDMNGKDFTLKNPSTSNKTYFKGRLFNALTTGSLQYWDGTTVFEGEEGREDITWKKNCKFIPRCGNIVFTNCKLRPHNDMIAGESDVGATLTLTYGPGCDHYAETAWDIFSARRGSKMIVDGGTYDHNLILYLGNNSAVSQNNKLEGNLVITNNGTVKLGTFCLHHGSVNQYSGLFSVPNDGKHGDGNEVRIGGWRASATPVANGRGNCVYNLWDGTFDVSSRVWMHIGSAETGTFNQFGGEASEYNPLLVGYHVTGTGTLNVHGGVFRQTGTGERALAVGYSGTGTVSVANGGRFVGAGPYGVQVAANAGSKGQVFLDPLGTLETTRVYAGAGTSALTFNGGTLKASSASFASTFLYASLGETAVTPLGGAIDTAGLGDFTLPKALTASNGRLAHRWSFEQGALTDAVGGSDAVAVGSVTRADGQVTLAGGKAGTSQLKLGTDLVPTTHGWTCEMWLTLKSRQNFSRLLQCGLTKTAASFFVSERYGSGAWYISFAGGEARGAHVMQVGVPYHLSVTLEPLETGAWTMVAALRNAETGALIDTLTRTSATTWNPSQLQQTDGFWVGNGAWGDNDPSATVQEIRMHGYVLSQAMLAASAQWGAHGHFFAKKGTGSLTLTGANSYTAGTSVEAGSLKVAAGGSLPQTPLSVSAGATLDLTVQGGPQTVNRLVGSGMVKGGALSVSEVVAPGGEGTIGTLTLDGTAFSATKLLVDVAADGSCDAVAGTGVIDLTGLTLEVANPEAANPDRSYQVLRGASVVGKLAATNLPRRWVATVSATGVRVVYGGGTVLLVR